MKIRQDRLPVNNKFGIVILSVLISASILAGCASQSITQPKPTSGSTSVSVGSPDTYLTATVLSVGETQTSTAIQPTPTPTKFYCPEKRGAITRSFIISKELPGRLYYSIYLPPCYSKADKYPVLYLLHGLSYQDDQWIRLGLPEVMDGNITDGIFTPFIVVMPYDPGWNDPNVGKYDRAIATELVPWIDSTYSTKTDRAFRAIGGLSRGSAWAFHAGIRYAKVFSIVGIHSPAFFKGDRQKMETILSELSSSSYPLRFVLDVGTRDPELNYATRFEGFLTKDSIEHSWETPSGTHSEAYWRENLEKYLELYSRDW